FFFFQAEDGIRYFHVTGVQTCALPICKISCVLFSISSYSSLSDSFSKFMFSVLAFTLLVYLHTSIQPPASKHSAAKSATFLPYEIGRASCRERGESRAVVVVLILEAIV